MTIYHLYLEKNKYHQHFSCWFHRVFNWFTKAFHFVWVWVNADISFNRHLETNMNCKDNFSFQVPNHGVNFNFHITCTVIVWNFVTKVKMYVIGVFFTIFGALFLKYFDAIGDACVSASCHGRLLFEIFDAVKNNSRMETCI